MAPNPAINGEAYDFAQVEIKVNGKTYSLIQEVTYSTKIERGKVRGTGPKVRQFTRGVKDEDGSLTWYKSGTGGWDEYVRDVGPGFMEKLIESITITYGNNRNPVVTDTLLGVKLASREVSAKEGNEPVMVKTALHIIDSLDNGVDPLNPAT
jgi:hypothetical protein